MKCVFETVTLNVNWWQLVTNSKARSFRVSETIPCIKYSKSTSISPWYDSSIWCMKWSKLSDSRNRTNLCIVFNQEYQKCWCSMFVRGIYHIWLRIKGQNCRTEVKLVEIYLFRVKSVWILATSTKIKSRQSIKVRSSKSFFNQNWILWIVQRLDQVNCELKSCQKRRF